MSLKYIREYYKVPLAKRGGSVSYKGRSGTITGASGPNIKVRFDFGYASKSPIAIHPNDPNLIYMKSCQCDEFDYCQTHGHKP